MPARRLAAAALFAAGLIQAAPVRAAHPPRQPGAAGAVALAADVTSAGALPSLSQRHRAYDWAVAQRGCWYAYGGAGPCSRGFDCSGLVWAAYHSAGKDLPRTTYEMLSSGMLRRVRGSQIRKGDLAFYGSGHVELWDRWHWTFGASTSGARIGYHYWARGAAWRPTAVYRVIDAG